MRLEADKWHSLQAAGRAYHVLTADAPTRSHLVLPSVLPIIRPCTDNLWSLFVTFDRRAQNSWLAVVSAVLAVCGGTTITSSAMPMISPARTSRSTLRKGIENGVAGGRLSLRTDNSGCAPAG